MAPEDAPRVVDDHELAVVARQIVGGAGDADAGAQQTHLELSKRLLASAVGMGDQRPYRRAAVARRGEGLLQIGEVEAENGDVDGFLRLTNGAYDRGDAV